jgi:hypothetical protein
VLNPGRKLPHSNTVSNTKNIEASKMKRVWITQQEDEKLLALLICLLSDREELGALLAAEPQTLPVIRF